MSEFFVKDLLRNIGWFDGFFISIIVYSTIQCFVKGFTLSFVSFYEMDSSININNYFSSEITTMGV